MPFMDEVLCFMYSLVYENIFLILNLSYNLFPVIYSIPVELVKNKQNKFVDILHFCLSFPYLKHICFLSIQYSLLIKLGKDIETKGLQIAPFIILQEYRGNLHPASHGRGAQSAPYFCIANKFLLRASKVTNLFYFS